MTKPFVCPKCENFETVVGRAAVNGVKHKIKRKKVK